MNEGRPDWIPTVEDMEKTYPQHFGRLVDLTGSINKKVEAFPLGKNTDDFVLEYIYAMFPEVGAAPTGFPDITVAIEDESKGIVYAQNIPLNLLATPGRYNPLGNTGTPFNGQFQGAQRLGFEMYAQSSFTVTFKNFGGVNKPDFIDMVFVGYRDRDYYE